jgi:hypothetical protein
MKARTGDFHATIPGAWLWLSLGLFLGTGPPAAAQDRYRPAYQEPRWLTFHISEMSAGVYAEGMVEETRYDNSSTSVSHEHLFLGPSLGLNADGSIYHPNLARYFINTEGAFGWAHDSVTGSESRDEWDYLGHFSVTLDLLENKPYHGSLFANYDHTFRDNDFFNRVTVDGWRYGARSAWKAGSWLFNADYLHRDEESTSPFPVTRVITVTNVVNGTNVITVQTNKGSFDSVSVTREDTFNFSARQERPSGGSSFNYSWNRYDRTDVGGFGEGNDNSFAAADTERFGANDRYVFNGNLSYILRDTSEEQSDEIIANTIFSAEHRDNLNSFYDLSYDRFTTGSFDSDNYSAQGSLRHQLYDSLTSTVTLRASDSEVSDRNTSGYTRRYGGGLSEYYTKLTGENSRVRISNSVFVDHTDQANAGVAKNERHSFLEGGPVPDSFFLNLPNVLELTIMVTDLNNTQPPLLEGFDYRVSRFGSRTVIERLHPGVPTDVLVDYRAEPSPPGSYETVTEAFQIRFELWKNLLGVYARLNLSLNNAPAELRVQDIKAYVFGADFNWRFFRGGAEYEIYDSSESDYRSVRLFQSVSFRPDDASTLTVDFTESWIDYVNTSRQEQNYQFITRYRRVLTRRLAFDGNAGISIRRGFGVDQILAAIRPSIKYVIGKTTLDAGYDYEYKLFLNNEERQKHMFFVRARRVF